MAKLPTYERQAVLMSGIDQIQAPNLNEQVRRSRSIQGGLDVISKFAQSQAEREVIKQAQQYTVANPLTAQQLEQAQTTGVNPIEAALNGGMVWNDALQKLYAQQASTELTNVAYKHYESVYDRVKSGELSDPAVIQQQLETPLKSWSGVIAQIDPQEANAFYQRRITDGNSYYKASLKEVRSKEQDRQDAIAEDTMYGIIKQFEVDVKNQEPGVVFAKYLNGQKEASALFQNSPRKQQYQNEIEKEFTTALFNHLSSEFQGVYGSSDEMMDAMQQGELGKYSEIWSNLTPTQKKSLESVVNSDFSRIDSANRSKLKVLTDQGKDIQTAILNGDDPANWKTEFNTYRTNANNISGSLNASAQQDIAMTEAVMNISEMFKYKSLPAIQQEIDMMRENPDIYPKAIVELAETHYSKLEQKRKGDLAEFAIMRNKGTAGNVDLFYGNDPQQLKASFNEQFGLVSSHPDYKPGQTNLLTKVQTNDLVNFLSSDIGKVQKAQVAYNIVSAFGEESISILNEIAPKDPVFARMGGLIMESPDARTVIDKMMTGQALIDNKQVGGKLKSTRMLETSKSITKALEFAHPLNTESVFAAADAYYVAMGGDTENIIDEKLYEEALNKVTGSVMDNAGNQYGGVAKMNGDVVLVDNNIRADLVDDYVATAQLNDFASSRITDLTEEQMQRYSDNLDLVDPQGVPYSTTDLNRATLKQTTEGYVLADENGNPFADQNGRQYLFDLNVLKEIYDNKMNPRLGPIDAFVPSGGDTTKLRRKIEEPRRESRGTKKTGPR